VDERRVEIDAMRQRHRGASEPFVAAALLLPYGLVLGIFFLAPIAREALLSFQHYAVGGPLDPRLRLDNYARLFNDPFYVRSLFATLKVGALVTALTLLLGYPVAYSLARARAGSRWVLRLLLLAPLLVSVVIRSYGWIILLAQSGPVNQALLTMHVVSQPVKFLFNLPGVVVGLVEVGVPLVALTLVGVVENVDIDLEEAALTLGASRIRTFVEVVIPLTVPGILAGSMLVFAVSVASFVTPALLGGPALLVLATLIYQQFMVALDWSFGAALAMTLLVASLLIFVVSTKIVAKRPTARIT